YAAPRRARLWVPDDRKGCTRPRSAALFRTRARPIARRRRVMAQRSATTIELDEPRVLLYRIRDVVDLEAALGNESLEEALTKRGFRRLSLFMWAGLRQANPKLTPEQTIK